MKNLIYYTVGFMTIYEDLFIMSLKSLEKFYNNDFDVLVICNETNKIGIQKKLNSKIPIQFLTVDCHQKKDSSKNKLKIHQFDKLNEYEKVIFCDCDILWFDSPNKIFDVIEPNKINFSEENGYITEQYWGLKLLNHEEIIKYNKKPVKGVNAGFFSFYSNMGNVFSEIEKFMDENITKINVCWEQPYLNVYLHRNDLISRTLNNHINHHVKDNDIPNKTVSHFSGSPGAGKGKLNKMERFLEKNKI